jgi:hypothetical protein
MAYDGLYAGEMGGIVGIVGIVRMVGGYAPIWALSNSAILFFNV